QALFEASRVVFENSEATANEADVLTALALAALAQADEAAAARHVAAARPLAGDMPWPTAPLFELAVIVLESESAVERARRLDALARRSGDQGDWFVTTLVDQIRDDAEVKDSGAIALAQRLRRD
ncbi:MAG: hypothetical protein AAGA95_04095, partial [Pseudomonadota bacterium]